MKNKSEHPENARAARAEFFKTKGFPLSDENLTVLCEIKAALAALKSTDYATPCLDGSHSFKEAPASQNHYNSVPIGTE